MQNVLAPLFHFKGHMSSFTATYWPSKKTRWLSKVQLPNIVNFNGGAKARENIYIALCHVCLITSRGREMDIMWADLNRQKRQAPKGNENRSVLMKNTHTYIHSHTLLILSMHSLCNSELAKFINYFHQLLSLNTHPPWCC